MFFVNNVYGGREPYRVQEVQKDKQDDQRGSGGHHFNDESEAEVHEKFLAAKEKFRHKELLATAQQIMSKQLVTLKGELSLEEAWKEIKNHEIKYYPIVGVEEKLIGLLSEREILRLLQHGKEKKLSEVVNTETLCADPETELSDILAVFSTEKVEAVPIVNQKEKVVGILTQNDLIQTMIKITHLKFQ